MRKWFPTGLCALFEEPVVTLTVGPSGVTLRCATAHPNAGLLQGSGEGRNPLARVDMRVVYALWVTRIAPRGSRLCRVLTLPLHSRWRGEKAFAGGVFFGR